MGMQGLRENLNGGLRSSSNLNGVYRARVENNVDPNGRGRVQIRVPAMHGLKTDGTPSEDLPWASMLSSSAGCGYGSFMVPEVGEYVMVQFEDGNPYKPILMGSLYGSGSKNIKTYGSGEEDDPQWEGEPGLNEVPEEAQRTSPTLKVLYKSPSGSMIAIDEAQGKEGIILQDGLGQHISIATNLSEAGKGPKASRDSEGTSIELKDMNGQTITMSSSKEGNTIKLKSTGGYSLTIDPDEDGFRIKADNAYVHIDTEGNISMKGKEVNIVAEEDVLVRSTEKVTIVSSDDMSLRTSGSLSIRANDSIGISGDGVTIGSPVTLIDPVE